MSRPVATLQQYGSDIMVSYPPGPACAGISLVFSRFVDHKETLSAEVTIVSLGAGEVAWSRINLVSSQGRRALAKAAEAESPEAPWPSIVDEACRMVAKHLRTGEPMTEMVPHAEDEAEAYLVPGLIPRRKTTVLFGDGGSGKSLLALSIGLYGVLGHALSQRWAVAPIDKVLYLDWESDRADHENRLWALTRGLEEVPPGRIYYRRFYKPLTEHIDAVQMDVAKHGIDFVVCDSLGAAGGPEPESSDASIRTLMALRSLGVTVIVVAHVSKVMADSDAPARPFGSVYVSNLARSTIEVKRRETGGGDSRLSVSLYHRKSNRVKVKPSALAFTFEADRILVSADEPEISQKMLLSDRILTALTANGQTVTAIAEKIDAKVESVRTVLNRNENRNGIHNDSDGVGGRGKETLWWREDRNRNGGQP